MDNINSNRIWYKDDATVAKFLLGGIGTGNFSIGSRGQMCDWEIFNRPQKGGKLSYTFFAIRTQEGNDNAQVKILESKLRPPFETSNGYWPWDGYGIPRFEEARISGEVSKAMVELRDPDMPVDVDLVAFTPFIPLDAANSGIPAAVIRYKVKNKKNRKINVSIAGSIINAVGFSGYVKYFPLLRTEGKPINEYREMDGLRGLYYTNPDLPEGHLTAGSMSLVTTTKENVTVTPYWSSSGWWNGAHEFWHDFEQDGKLEIEPTLSKHKSALPMLGEMSVGSICSDFELDALEEKEIEFIISWYFPDRPAKWAGGMMFDRTGKDDGRRVKNYYTNLFKSAWDVDDYLVKNLVKLEKQSDDFRRALYQTTLPPVMIDAMAANITVLRSNTCFRLENGTFLGWEGCFDDAGSCEGNCSHVWNYQQILAFLFPELEQTMRRINFIQETDEDGEMCYRANVVFGFDRFKYIPPCADGQMGTIVQLYWDWKISGDDEFLKEMWEPAVRALEYAFTKWDKDGDFVFESEQHNTYDIEFYGVSSMTNSIFYAALKAAEEIARYLGEDGRAEKYKKAREQGSRKMDEMLFNDEYYIQKLNDRDTYNYQYHEGCLSDQVFGQELAHIAGLGYILPEEHVKKAIHSVFKYNFKSDMTKHVNVQRVYGLNNEGGLITCTWPHGEKPIVPFVYSDELWSGIEYQVASHLVYEGYFDEAMKVVSASRNRYDGVKRNPWDEVEQGHHYVRSMACWGLLIAASGYQYDMTKGQIGFEPVVSKDDFTCFFSNAKCWGLYHQKMDDASGELQRSIEILYGDGEGITLM